jgi:hypothetical protein
MELRYLKNRSEFLPPPFFIHQQIFRTYLSVASNHLLFEDIMNFVGEEPLLYTYTYHTRAGHMSLKSFLSSFKKVGAVPDPFEGRKLVFCYETFTFERLRKNHIPEYDGIYIFFNILNYFV